jgi:hypothetical protein
MTLQNEKDKQPSPNLFGGPCSGRAPKMTTTMSNSVSSKDPVMEWSKSFLPETSKNVKTMMAKSANPEIRLQS